MRGTDLQPECAGMSGCPLRRAQGMSNDEIAGKLGKKAGTIKFHSHNIFRKLQVQNRQRAVNRARENGLL